MKKETSALCLEGMVPHDGMDPQVYSTTIPFQPTSYLRINGENTIPEEEKKYLPTSPAPTYLNEVELQSRLFSKKEEILKASSIIVDHQTGGVKMVDEEFVKGQRSLFGDVLIKLGRSFFNSNVVRMSMPVRLLEPRGDLDRMGEIFRVFGYYLAKAAKIADKLERLKLVSVGFVACNYLMLRKQKSFNPLLGETMQATLADGTELYGEQISHHPAISYFNVFGPNKSYSVFAHVGYGTNFKGTYMEIELMTKMTILFKDGHKMQFCTQPMIKVTGLMIGQRGAFLKGMALIEDATLKLRSVTFFDYGEKKGLLSSEKTVPKDWVEGVIYASTGAPFNANARRIADLDDIKKEFARMKGSWLEKLEVNSVNYWDVEKLAPLTMTFTPNPLPSDWRYREDLVWVRRNRYDLADSWKDVLEIRQRRDRKLREDYAKAKAAASSS